MTYKTKNRKGFTLAETLITIAIIAVIAVLTISVLSNGKTRQKDYLSRLNVTYSNLNNMVGKILISSEIKKDWQTDVNALTNLSCTNASGADETNKSLCLKNALKSVSKKLADCSSNAACFKDYSGLTTQLTTDISSLIKVDELQAFKMPGGITVLMSYIDGACKLDIPINKVDNKLETVYGCGVMVVDVNGTEGPNSLSTEDNNLVDRFLLAITADGLVKSSYLDKLVCSGSLKYDATQRKCVKEVPCTIDMDEMQKIEAANDSNDYYKSEEISSTCYKLSCKEGNYNPLTYKCPKACADGEVRAGGLWYNEGGDLDPSTEKACCIPIYTQEDLNNVRNGLDKTYCLMNDITFDKSGAGSDATKGWTPIGLSSTPFSGTLYGNGKKISGLYINNNSLVYAGLFSYTKNATIKDLIMDGGEIYSASSSSFSYAGAVVGRDEASSVFTNLINTSSAKAFSSVSPVSFGGIAGRADASTSSFTNIINTGFIEAPSSTYSYSGGVVGLSYAPLTNVINSGSVKSSSSNNYCYSGGVAGQAYTSFTNIINVGNIETNASALASSGGVVGWAPSSAGASYTNIINVGGIKAVSSVSTPFSGGVAGVSYAPFTNIINAGNIEASNSSSAEPYSGGVVGQAYSTLRNIINASSVQASSSYASAIYWGGIAGQSSSSFANIINTGLVGAASASSGGVAGQASSALANAYYLSNTAAGCVNGAAYSGCSVKTETALKQSGTYAGFDTTNWSVVNGYYPTLKAALMPPQVFRDCRNNSNPYGGCYDVPNTPNTFIPNDGSISMWAWRKPTSTSVLQPVLKFQCKPYRTSGYDCCVPSYIPEEKRYGLSACPALDTSAYSNYRGTN